MYVDHPTAPAPAHRFNGYFFTYPGEEGHRGLVSTIQEDPPMLNWIFVDADTRAVRHAGRKDSIGHVIGPWGWSEDERWLTLRGSEKGFVVVEERMARSESPPGEGEGRQQQQQQEEKVANEGHEDDENLRPIRWTVYWDPDSLLRDQKTAEGKRCIPCGLRRRMKLGMESTYVKGGDKQEQQGG
jgi:hypothetical protein